MRGMSYNITHECDAINILSDNLHEGAISEDMVALSGPAIELLENNVGSSKNSYQEDEGSSSIDENAPLISIKRKRRIRTVKSTSNKELVQRKASKPTKQKSVFTPLEQQYLELKKNYQETILAIEVGYKFRFFGKDAKIASEVLGISCYFEHNFLNASVPSYRIDYHLERLINFGLKVAVVRQTETAALKSTSSSRNTLFDRRVARVLTKGTTLDDSFFRFEQTQHGTLQASQFILCVADNVDKSKAKSGRVQVGLIAIQLSSGTTVYDHFQDDFLRSELQTRLSHFQPCELIYSNKLSSESVALLNHYVSTEKTCGRVVRVQHAVQQDVKLALENLQDFFSSKCIMSGSKIIELHMEKVKSLHSLSIICLDMAISYLMEFSLEDLFVASNFYQPFDSISSMVLSKQALEGLELFVNQTDHTPVGSLFWVLDRTYTRFGQRMLQRWLQKPLVDKENIIERLDAVEELAFNSNSQVQAIRKMLYRLPDLEKGLSRIYYQRGFYKAASAFSKNSYSCFKSALLRRLIQQLPSISSIIDHFLGMFDQKEAENNNKVDMFKDIDNFDLSEEPNDVDYELAQEIRELKMSILMVRTEMDFHLQELRDYLEYPNLEFSIWGNVKFCIEVSKGCKKIPPDWIKLSSTRSLFRFHTPKIQSLLIELSSHEENLTISSEKIYRSFLSRISEHYNELRNVTTVLGTLDCLISFARISSQSGYTRPEFSDKELLIHESRHPMIELLSDKSFVPNHIHLSSDGVRCLLITGPNMGGKSSFVKQLALSAIMAQSGCFVPAKSALLPIFDSILIRMGSSDNLSVNMSTFMVEMLETKEVLSKATEKSMVIIDELGRGTSTIDGEAISYAVLHYLNQYIKSYLLFVTHFPSLGILERRFEGQLRCFHMGYLKSKEDFETSVSQSISFLYKLVPGVASKSYGLNVARMAGIPFSILSRATEISENYEKKHRNARKNVFIRKVAKLLMILNAEEIDFKRLFYDLTAFEEI
uniref:DNA mismatch repair protein msh3 n=1 Tax=Schizosaccharomyces pombe (strain 972 / ATCC 24843) TaxID=284812 RepID=MSH3_SCHPO|nr:RecName: Full=DNA mismatch repair protein msh3; AltName: Full=Mating-type switching protein swi4; AltName: Full=MutS protein homolog 3 [Schizosaccharomyces pombe 972h-]CAA43603.1 Swi4 [Schizosaccharomyces pombe]